MLDSDGLEIPECAICGEIAPLSEESGPVVRLLVDSLPYEVESYDEVFAHLNCFRRATPWGPITGIASSAEANRDGNPN